MRINPHVRGGLVPPRARRSPLMAVSLAFAVLSCTDATSSDPGRDRTAPRVELEQVVAPADSMLAFAVNVRDNLGIRTVSVRVTGALNRVFDTTFTTAITQIALPFALTVPASIPPGTRVNVTATALDGAGNISAVDSLILIVRNLKPGKATITSPVAGTPVIIGKSILIALSGQSPLKLRALGYSSAGVVSLRDSTLFNSPLRDTIAIIDTLAIPSNTPAGSITLTPFLVDSLGQTTAGASVTLSVQATSTVRPEVSLGVTRRLEVTDTLHVEGSSPSGVTRLGYEVRDATTNQLLGADSISSSGALTSLIKTFMLRLVVPTFPARARITAFVVDGDNARATLADTVQIVAGVTKSIPFGGAIADALYHPPTDAIYLTNIERNQLEVFSVRDSAFKTPIVVGSRPWGLTAWPQNRDGSMSDTLLVANSGGTTISYVNVRNGREFRRYYLPNIVAYSVTSVLSQSTGKEIQQRTVYDFSDRPEFVASLCQTGSFTPADTLPGAPCGKVFLVYSTSPTGGQSLPFPNRGTVRWENLTNRESHFFFEQAIGQAAGRSDTLEIERFASNGEGRDSLLLSYRQEATVTVSTPSGPVQETAFASVVVDVQRLAFRDTTFVRNSGNFRRTIIGEGGNVLGSRAIGYDVTRGLASLVLRSRSGGTALGTPVIDLGISRPTDVSDYVANTFATVRGVGINFDGTLAAIRADSTYIINSTLRLLGLFQTSGGNSGFDFHPRNTSISSFPLSTRLAFAASKEPLIEIYDTYCYRRVGSVPLRDPVIGPIKAALRPTTGEIVLVGATSNGVVIAALPNTFGTTCP